MNLYRAIQSCLTMGQRVEFRRDPKMGTVRFIVNDQFTDIKVQRLLSSTAEESQIAYELMTASKQARGPVEVLPSSFTASEEGFRFDVNPPSPPQSNADAVITVIENAQSKVLQNNDNNRPRVPWQIRRTKKNQEIGDETWALSDRNKTKLDELNKICDVELILCEHNGVEKHRLLYQKARLGWMEALNYEGFWLILANESCLSDGVAK